MGAPALVGHRAPRRHVRFSFSKDTLGILLGLTAAFAWAGADFLARHVSRRIGSYRTFVLAQCVGLAALSAYLAATGHAPWGHLSALSAPTSETRRSAWAWLVGAGVINIAASLSLYRAFAVGKLALVTPISASYPALTVILALASGERLKTTAGVGVIAVLAGVFLAVMPAESLNQLAEECIDGDLAAKTERGVGWALGAALGFGILFWLLGFRVTRVLGGALPVWLMRLMGATLILSLALRRSPDPVIPRGGVWWPLAGSALLDTTAFVSNNAGLATGQVSVVTVLASLFGAVAVLLAWVFLGERLSRRQWFGISLILLGVALVSV